MPSVSVQTSVCLGIAAGERCGQIVELDRREGEAASAAFLGDLVEFQRQVGGLREVGGDLQRAFRRKALGRQPGAAGRLRLVDQHEFGAMGTRQASDHDIRLEAAAHLDVEQERLATLGIGGAGLRRPCPSRPR